MFLYMPIDDRTSLSVSSVMAVGFGIGSPMEGRPDLIRSVSSLRDSAEVSPPAAGQWHNLSTMRITERDRPIRNIEEAC